MRPGGLVVSGQGLVLARQHLAAAQRSSARLRVVVISQAAALLLAITRPGFQRAAIRASCAQSLGLVQIP